MNLKAKEFPWVAVLTILHANGLEVVARGSVPDWFERVESMPNVELYRMKRNEG